MLTDNAKTPQEISRRGWKDIMLRVYQKVGEQNVSMMSAAIAFYAMLATFPALGAIVTVYALVSDPVDVRGHFESVAGILPAEVSAIFMEQLEALANRPQETLGFGLVLGVIFAVWSAHRGVHAMVHAITVAYQEKETRNFIHLNAVTFLLTLGAVIVVVLTMLLMLGLPAVLSFVPVADWLNALSKVLGWITFFLVVVAALGYLYRSSPPRRSARWRWLSPGALTATGLWMVGSIGFSVYVGRFGNYNETYGALGAIIILLLWFYISSFAVILGALLNAEMEHQTHKDTTVGAPKPLGERGAVVADTVPETSSAP